MSNILLLHPPNTSTITQNTNIKLALSFFRLSGVSFLLDQTEDEDRGDHHLDQRTVEEVRELRREYNEGAKYCFVTFQTTELRGIADINLNDIISNLLY